MRHLYKFSVTVQTAYKREFPIDMLRYDGCFPDEERDSGKIMRSLRDGDMSAEDGTVYLVKYTDNRAWKPNQERWASFGWTVARYAEQG